MILWFAVGINDPGTVVWTEQGGDTDRWGSGVNGSSDTCTYSCTWVFLAIFDLAAEIWTD
jgi:hypothetical protein